MAAIEFARKNILAKERFDKAVDESLAQCNRSMRAGTGLRMAINEHRLRIYHANKTYQRETRA